MRFAHRLSCCAATYGGDCLEIGQSRAWLFDGQTPPPLTFFKMTSRFSLRL
jgi:hypothetical protein